MTENKEKFYVFSGIEHNLTGTDYLNRYYGAAGVDYGYVFANKHCMSALNKLLESLEEKYDTTLVITSGKRENPNYCIEYLNYNGLKYDKPIYFTKFVAGPRGEKIVDFLEEQGASPLEFHKAPLYVKFLKYFKDNPDFKNYVVLDIPQANISKYIPASQLKKLNPRAGLTIKDTAEILAKHNIELKLDEPQKGVQ